MKEADGPKKKDAWELVFLGVAILWCLFHVYTTAFGAYRPLIQRPIFLAFALVVTFAFFPTFKRKATILTRSVDIVLMLISVAVCIYVVVNEIRFLETSGEPITRPDMIMGILAILLTFEATRRTTGLSLPIIAVVAALYGYFGPYLPGMFGHASITWERMIDTTYRTDFGLWGLITGIGATVIGAFMVFGAVLFSTGASETFKDLAFRLVGRFRGGAAQVAIVGSSLFGMISGTAAGNVATTGVFSIPLMKKLGYKPEFAGAVESVASTGGQLVPPIMGAAAFVMAEILGVDYLKICLAAIIPAILFYGTVMAAVAMESRNIGLKAVPKDQLPKWRDIVVPGRWVPLVVPILVLLYLLLTGKSLLWSLFCAMASSVVLYIIFNPRNAVRFVAKEIWVELASTGRSLTVIAGIVSCASIVVGLIGQTGLGLKISEIIIALSAHSLLLALILTALISIILGMGMPTVAAYLVGASVMGPALMKLGLHELVAHFFIFYFSLLSAITPPVCGACFVAAAIADTMWEKVAKNSLRLAGSLFLIPLVFTDTNSLLLGLGWEGFATVFAYIRVIFIVILFVGGSIGYLGGRWAGWSRFVAIVAALGLATPYVLVQCACLGGGIVVLAFEFWGFWRGFGKENPAEALQSEL